MTPVCFEHHLDRYVETGHLSSTVRIQRTIRINAATGTVQTQGKRIGSTGSMVIAKIYEVNEGAEGIFGKVSSSLMFMEKGDQLELNGTVTNAYGTGITIITAGVSEHSPKKRLSTTFKAFPHEFTFRTLPGHRLKPCILQNPMVIETEEVLASAVVKRGRQKRSQ